MDFSLVWTKGNIQSLIPTQAIVVGQMGCLLEEEWHRNIRIIHSRVQNGWRKPLAYSYRSSSVRFNGGFYWPPLSTPCSLQTAFWEWEQAYRVKMERNRLWQKCMATSVFFLEGFGVRRKEKYLSFPPHPHFLVRERIDQKNWKKFFYWISSLLTYIHYNSISKGNDRGHCSKQK